MKKYLVLVAMLLAACGEKDQNKEVAAETNNEVAVVDVQAVDGVFNLTLENNHADLSAQVGQEIDLRLKANATTGYKWNFVTYVSEDDAVEELEETYIEDEHSEGMVGVGGTAVYRIKLLKPGVNIVTANYERDADKVEPKEDDEFVVRVVVE